VRDLTRTSLGPRALGSYEGTLRGSDGSSESLRLQSHGANLSGCCFIQASDRFQSGTKSQKNISGKHFEEFRERVRDVDGANGVWGLRPLLLSIPDTLANVDHLEVGRNRSVVFRESSNLMASAPPIRRPVPASRTYSA
jgi:hypothetical protein